MVLLLFVGRPRTKSSATPSDEALAAVELAMVKIRRSFTSRAISRLLERELGQRIPASRSFVVDALDQGPVGDDGITVGDVADRLGIDASRASRIVSEAVSAGDVVRVVSQKDGRKSCLELTAQGRALVREASRHRRRFFAATMKDWNDGDKEDFARLLTRFVGSLSTASDRLRDER